MPFVVDQPTDPKPEKKPETKTEKTKDKPKEVTPLEKYQYNGLWYAPALKKFVDPETDVPISDHTFEYPTFQTLPMLPPLSPVEYPTEDTVDWILEVVKGLPNFWYARKFTIGSPIFTVTAKQWQVEVTKRDGRNLVFSPGLAAIILMKRGEADLLQSLDLEFPK